jgi:hypothetical protein
MVPTLVAVPGRAKQQFMLLPPPPDRADPLTIIDLGKAAEVENCLSYALKQFSAGIWPHPDSCVQPPSNQALCCATAAYTTGPTPRHRLGPAELGALDKGMLLLPSLLRKATHAHA